MLTQLKTRVLDKNHPYPLFGVHYYCYGCYDCCFRCYYGQFDIYHFAVIHKRPLFVDPTRSQHRHYYLAYHDHRIAVPVADDDIDGAPPFHPNVLFHPSNHSRLLLFDHRLLLLLQVQLVYFV